MNDKFMYVVFRTVNNEYAPPCMLRAFFDEASAKEYVQDLQPRDGAYREIFDKMRELVKSFSATEPFKPQEYFNIHERRDYINQYYSSINKEICRQIAISMPEHQKIIDGLIAECDNYSKIFDKVYEFGFSNCYIEKVPY